mmetsp:Transcript_56644/g.171423  ORF Transcript_56644/g.171423 Transcript_56644/m.171423 type:complete len:392 (+) Transcript_56644:54-1229(+)
MPERILKISFKGELHRLKLSLRDGACAREAFDVVQCTVQRGLDLHGVAASSTICRYKDEEGDLCTLTEHSLDDWMAQGAEGALRLTVDLSAGAVTRQRLEATPAPGAHPARAHGDLRRSQGSDDDDPAVISHLERLAQSADEQVRRSSVAGLRKKVLLGSHRALAALTLLTSSDDEHVRRASADAICAAAVTGNSTASAALEILAGSSDEHIRRSAAALLGHASEAAEPRPKRVRLEADSSERDVREPLARVEAQGRRAAAGDEAAVADLGQMAHGPAEAVRRRAADALAAALEAGHACAVPSVSSLASHADEHIRRGAARALARAAAAGHAPREVADALVALTSHEDEEVRRSAGTALCAGAGGPEVIESLARHSDEDIRRAAAAALCLR